MFLEPVVAAAGVALTSLIGVLFFGNSQLNFKLQKYFIPVAVGVFLSLVLFELIPETLTSSPELGGLAVAFGFISFYVLANYLHKKHHTLDADNCDKKSAANLLLIGDSIHNMADGVILGGAFLIDPSVGVATALGLALHEIPQEIVEFGLLIRGGYTRLQASLFNLLSASSIVLGVVLITLAAEYAEGFVWIITGIAAGNLLFLATSDLLPRIHDNPSDKTNNIWQSTILITVGFLIMTLVVVLAHGHHEDEHDKHPSIEHELSLR